MKHFRRNNFKVFETKNPVEKSQNQNSENKNSEPKNVKQNSKFMKQQKFYG